MHLQGWCWVPTRILVPHIPWVPTRILAAGGCGQKASGSTLSPWTCSLAAVAKGELMKAIRILNSNSRVAHQH